MKRILVIGGSRYFGKHLVNLLAEAGHAVSVLNRGSAVPPRGVGHLVADRDDEERLRAALGGRTFDAVVAQVCYTPGQAAVARRVFAGRTGRYVMTSTMEVYDPAPPTAEALGYAEGKRRAEEVFLAEPAPFAFATVRTAHVLGGGRAEFTGRLAHYVGRIAAGAPVEVHAAPYATSFIHHHEIAEFLGWAATGAFTGAVDAASHGALDVRELCGLIAGRLVRPVRYRVVAQGAAASPFSFDRAYALDNSRAGALGFRFGHVADWLPRAVDETLRAAPDRA
ncbi:NAD-dependent epimerase/dehydratase family protein [Streptomyces goshikiensis]|uniref:NAD-dependent epimerase/dehydratase family protein n=1 Tax=Streptomyces goshikiensis TaxID=1942 RepID=UPI0022F3D76D|nr:NAD-dependent epimerase/dehydratase family protein [Streptomyces goshikiensis]WBY18872.1 reductase [Streptomyces goshikiensis]